MTGILISQAALAAALKRAQADGTLASLACLDTLLTLLDPAHQPPPADQLVRAGTIQGEAPTPAATAPAERFIPTAGTPAPPTPSLPAAAAEAPPPLAILRRAPSGGGGRPVEKWTAERLALLHAEWPTTTDRAALLARVNALPGEPVASLDAMRAKAHMQGLRADPAAVREIQSAAGVRGGRASVAAHPPARPSEVRTPERFAAFPALWKDRALSVGDIQARINAMPGKPMASSTALYRWAQQAGLSTHRPQPGDPEDTAEAPAEPAAEPPHDAAPDAPAAPAPCAPPAAPAPMNGNQARASAHHPRRGPHLPATPGAKADAFEAFAAGMSARAVADDFGIGLNTISNWYAEWRSLKQAKAEDAA